MKTYYNKDNERIGRKLTKTTVPAYPENGKGINTMLYYDNENDTVIEESEIIKSYQLFRSEYETYSDYKNDCMCLNNGCLILLTDKINSLLRKRNRIQPQMEKYFTEEIVELESQIAYYKSFLKGENKNA